VTREELPPFDDIQSDEPQGMPHSRQAEEAVIGAVLINPETYYDVAQFLRADDFYIIRNRWIWEVFTELHERHAKLDYLTVCDMLENRGQLGEIGGAAYITAMINQTPTSLHAQEYGHIIEEASIRRRMLASANDMARLAMDTARTVDTVLNEAEKSIFSISDRRATKEVQPIRSVLSAVYDRVDRLAQADDEIAGVPTGLKDLDTLLGGLQKSDQKYKKHVAIFSLEMSNEQLVQRLIAQETGIDTQRLRTGKLKPDEWPLFTHAIEVLSDTTIFLDDTPAITPIQLRTKCRRLMMEFNLDLVIVDYLQLMASDSRNENRVQEVAYISRTLKGLARELNVPVLTAAQLSRAVEHREGKKPQLSDLRESGSIEQDADIVVFIHRAEAEELNREALIPAELIVAKHRNGPTHGGIGVLFHNNLARFEQAARMEAPIPPLRPGRN
jgi:replicative DNA helicase